MSKPRNPSRARKGRTRSTPISRAALDRSSSNGLQHPPSGDQEKQIQDLVNLLKRNNLTELEWECETFRVRLRHEALPKPLPASGTDTMPIPQLGPGETVKPVELMDTTGLVTITSPIVGTFYRSPDADADPYVEETDLVKKGQVLCIVEAMKLMNEIVSEVDGRIVKILAESTTPVEYGQPLFLIDPTAAA